MPLYAAEYENLLRLLREFQATSADVESALLLTADGIPLAWSLPKTYDDAQVAHLAELVAAEAALGTALADAVWQLPPKMLSFTYENAYVIVVPLYLNLVLAVFARSGAKLALIFLVLQQHLSEGRRNCAENKLPLTDLFPIQDSSERPRQN
jgi:predicted regulator of Ras-like GTPase activity (Roadblock/LC7/MglB family)